MPAKPPHPPAATPDPWRLATWEGARAAALLEGARMSMIEKLEWLEEAGRLAERLQTRRPLDVADIHQLEEIRARLQDEAPDPGTDTSG